MIAPYLSSNSARRSVSGAAAWLLLGFARHDVLAAWGGDAAVLTLVARGTLAGQNALQASARNNESPTETHGWEFPIPNCHADTGLGYVEGLCRFRDG